MSSRGIKRLLATIFLPLLLSSLVIFILPASSNAASGGRIGGGSFRAPSMPRTGGYRGGYGGGGYRGGYGGSGYRGGYGGGIGFPFLIPMFGFGGGGLFGFLILMAVSGILVNAFRGGRTSSIDNSQLFQNQVPSSATILQVQIGLLASAKELQDNLRQLATSSETSTSTGLQRVLQETTLALLRHPDLWVYANIESGSVPFQSAEATFNRLSMTERSKLLAELTTNVSGQRINQSTSEIEPGEPDATNEYIVVTLLLATKNQTTLSHSTTSQQIQENLRILGSTSSNDLMALEVIWQPEGSGEVLSAEELLTSYPNLQHL